MSRHRFSRAAAADASEDAAYSSEQWGDEPPDWMRDKQKRLARIRAAKAELEAEAKVLEAEAKAADRLRKQIVELKQALPPFAPAAETWARTIVESTIWTR